MFLTSIMPEIATRKLLKNIRDLKGGAEDALESGSEEARF